MLLPSPGAIDPVELAACVAVFQALEAGRLRAAMSAFGLSETIYALGRDQVSAERRRQVESDLLRLLTIVPVDAAIASAAAEHRLTHYHRSRAPVSYADAVALTIAKRTNTQLITVDTPLLALSDPRVIPPSQLRLSPS